MVIELQLDLGHRVLIFALKANLELGLQFAKICLKLCLSNTIQQNLPKEEPRPWGPYPLFTKSMQYWPLGQRYTSKNTFKSLILNLNIFFYVVPSSEDLSIVYIFSHHYTHIYTLQIMLDLLCGQLFYASNFDNMIHVTTLFHGLLQHVNLTILASYLFHHKLFGCNWLICIRDVPSLSIWLEIRDVVSLSHLSIRDMEPHTHTVSVS